MPLGARGSVGRDNGASLTYARFFKGTIRDAVAADPQAYHAFLGGIQKNLRARPHSLNFPEHKILAQFLAHFISAPEIFEK